LRALEQRIQEVAAGTAALSGTESAALPDDA
jgi:hypothetical protein